MKRKAFILSAVFLILILCSCAPLRRPIDARSGFSVSLKNTEENLRSGDWKAARISLSESIEVWERIKPYLQLDIDHDYINEIERNFILLEAYIETEEKPHCLALIILIRNTWENIGSM